MISPPSTLTWIATALVSKSSYWSASLLFILHVAVTVISPSEPQNYLLVQSADLGVRQISFRSQLHPAPPLSSCVTLNKLFLFKESFLLSVKGDNGDLYRDICMQSGP